MLDSELVNRLQLSPNQIGVLLIDHGSRRQESNALLLQVAELFKKLSGYQIVEPAHMEIASPSISQAFDSAIYKGATFVIAFPYFLAPGRHWNQDVPALVQTAAQKHPGVRYLVSAPLGIHPLMMQVMEARINECMSVNLVDAKPCDLCDDESTCKIMRT